MAWFLSSVGSIFGIGLVFWLFRAYEKRGIEEGARAAFQIEFGLSANDTPHDRKRLDGIFRNIKWDNVTEIKRTAHEIGEAYYSAIRRNAFEDCRVRYFTDGDRAEWLSAYGDEMPAISIDDGYLQAIKDVITGVAELTPTCFGNQISDEVVDRLNCTQKAFYPEMFSQPESPPFRPNGKLLGMELVRELVFQTMQRNENTTE